MSASDSFVFPFERILSLRYLIEYWRSLSEDEGSPHHPLAKPILEGLQQVPTLEEPINDLTLLEKHQNLLCLLMSAIFPMAIWDKAYMGAFRPYDMNVRFFASPALENLNFNEKNALNRKYEVHQSLPTSYEMKVGKAIHAYHRILKQFYGVDAGFNFPIVVSVPDPDQPDLPMHLKMSFNTWFLDYKTRGPLHPLSEEEIERLLGAPMDLDLWQELLPADNFFIEGFAILTAADITEQEVLSYMKHDLLLKDAMTSAEKVNHLRQRIRTFLRLPDLELGLLAIERSELDDITGVHPIGRSLLMYNNQLPTCPRKNQSSYYEALKSGQHVLIEDLKRGPVRSGYEYILVEQGYRSLLICPLLDAGRLVGFLELASPSAGKFTPFMASKLQEVLPLFATAMKRSLEEQEDRIQSVIKTNYTAIHPSVEWRFRKAALQFMEQARADQAPQLEPIVFHDVYPLYGLSDIRDNSLQRNNSIQADLLAQLEMVLHIVVEAGSYRSLPGLDEIAFRIKKTYEHTQLGLSAGDEVNVLQFIRTDIEALFDQFELFGPRVKKLITTYREALDPELGILYRERKAFEESVATINDTISMYIDQQEALAQDMFPHYFEKYKTDGVDYSIYIGSSLVEYDSFDLLYLHNLRLWQLMMMCGIVWTLNEKKHQLQTMLETAHLILVQHMPISIRFRQDEKRFDVDGAYNIRYEIIKKRIDKARILGLDERLTQPGKIAIVYSQSSEADEYRKYIDYLQASGYLKPTIEELWLEDQQGVSGLRALRVEVSDQSPASKSWINESGMLEISPASVPNVV